MNVPTENEFDVDTPTPGVTRREPQTTSVPGRSRQRTTVWTAPELGGPPADEGGVDVGLLERAVLQCKLLAPNGDFLSLGVRMFGP